MKRKNWHTIAVLCVLVTILACGCIEEEMLTEIPEIPTPPATNSTLATPAPSQEEKNIQIVTGIVEDYYKTHTYSTPVLFVCADMAIDVWNMVETQGINAEIAIGNVDNPNADWPEYNHAWVLAEASPNTWLALETTGGYVTYDEKYYIGYFFESPKEFKGYLELMKEYNEQIDRINELQVEYSDTYDEWVRETNYYEDLVNEFNRRYVGRSLSPEEYHESLDFQSKIYTQYAVVERVSGRADQLVDTINEENKRLTEITNELKGLLT
ncbi:MAG: hypothetical protein SVO01_11400 [Thermotogota bacterium]|nr:hypothetical protein [Thermotogota bacterium]